MMQRMTAPGLPQWPVLMFDSERCEAFVWARIANWKTGLQGETLAKVVQFANVLLSALAILKIFPEMANPVIRLAVCYVSWIAYLRVSYPLLKSRLAGVFSRQFFAPRVKLWFNENAIAFKSYLHEEPIIIRRNFRSIPVEIAFSILEDEEANGYLDSLPPDKKAGQAAISTSQRLCITIGHSTQDGTGNEGSQQVKRAIPVCSIPESWIFPFVAVCSAASQLTTSGASNQENSHKGADIDFI